MASNMPTMLNSYSKCWGEDLNLHLLRDQLLRLACLPISPPQHLAREYTSYPDRIQENCAFGRGVLIFNSSIKNASMDEAFQITLVLVVFTREAFSKEGTVRLKFFSHIEGTAMISAFFLRGVARWLGRCLRVPQIRIKEQFCQEVEDRVHWHVSVNFGVFCSKFSIMWGSGGPCRHA